MSIPPLAGVVLMVAGYLTEEAIPVVDPEGNPFTTGQNTPPFLMEIDLNSWSAATSILYHIPTTNASWKQSGDWFSPMNTGRPMVHSPEILVNTRGPGFLDMRLKGSFMVACC